MKACAKESSITRFVYTSSSVAATFPKPDTRFEITVDSYNEEGLSKGWKHPEDEPDSFRNWYVYAALKTETEKRLWQWMKEEKRSFVFNSIVNSSHISTLGARASED